MRAVHRAYPCWHNSPACRTVAPPTSIVLGPLASAIEWHERQHVDDILRRGVQAEASITGARIGKGRYSAYLLDLAWRDAQDAPRAAAEVSVSAASYRLATGVRPWPKVKIKYLADRDAGPRTVVLVDDPSRQERMVAGWLVLSLVGLAGAVAMTLWRDCRRRGAAQTA